MKKLLLSAAATALIASPALADNTDSQTVSVSGTVIAALELEETNGVDLPDVAVPATGEPDTTVSLTCDNTGAETVTYGGQGNPFAAGVATATAVSPTSANVVAGTGEDEGTCGEIAVTGEANFAYAITSGGTITQSVTATGTTLSNPVCTSASGNSASAGTITAGGTDTLYCGADLAVAAGATVGDFTDAAFDVTVVYD